MSGSVLEVELLDSFKEMEVIRDSWDALYECNPDASPSLSYEYFRAVLKHFGKVNAVKVAILRKDSEVYGIVPFQLKEKSWKKKVKFRYAQVCPDKWPPSYCGILSRSRNQKEIIQQVLSYLVRCDRSISFVLLNKVQAGSSLDMDNDPEFGLTVGSRLIRRKVGGNVVVRLGDSWEAFLQQLSPNMRKDLLRRMNVLFKRHQIEIACLPYEKTADSDLVNRLIRDALEVSRQSWQGSVTQGKAISDQDTHQFFEEVSKELSMKGRLDLSVLYVDKVPISFIWNVVRWPHVYFLKPGFVQSYSRFSPGKSHLGMLIANLIEKKGKSMDLGEDVHEYKHSWSREVVDVYDIYMFPAGVKGWALAKLFDMKLPQSR